MESTTIPMCDSPLSMHKSSVESDCRLAYTCSPTPSQTTDTHPPDTISPIGQVYISSTTIYDRDSPIDPQLHGVPPHSPEPNLISSDDTRTLPSSLSYLSTAAQFSSPSVTTTSESTIQNAPAQPAIECRSSNFVTQLNPQPMMNPTIIIAEGKVSRWCFDDPNMSWKEIFCIFCLGCMETGATRNEGEYPSFEDPV